MRGKARYYLLTFGILFLGPLLLWAVPMLLAQLRIFGMLHGYVGLDHYIRLFVSDPVFLRALTNTLVLTMLPAPLACVAAFFLAKPLAKTKPRVFFIVGSVFAAIGVAWAVALCALLISGDEYGLLLRLHILQPSTLMNTTPQAVIYMLSRCSRRFR